ncbi:hypothetical protein BO78DRAFT_177361 [Aspergillus sclerotiicarbonarius CBS 121057]|uniref:Uncharacterized protein n=1 Tax=Aspergillus sclerotiicarbonarius (strain CBS 121057 / IBT 28362) TaxID=1448318 RepID=A0A319E446_ASPSB|nr:hypothetical protein BO78DRAFT_177361 [Aspergillus sclerotiicarbonarius CBS 121057]
MSSSRLLFGLSVNRSIPHDHEDWKLMITFFCLFCSTLSSPICTNFTYSHFPAYVELSNLQANTLWNSIIIRKISQRILC